jgi:hypothetical protein
MDLNSEELGLTNKLLTQSIMNSICKGSFFTNDQTSVVNLKAISDKQ